LWAVWLCWVFLSILINCLCPIDYKEGIMVVFMIGLSKYFELILGNNNAIILILNIIKQFCFLGAFSCHSCCLNAIFIPIYGIVVLLFIYFISQQYISAFFVVKRLHFVSTVTSLWYVFIYCFYCTEFLAIISIGFKSILVTLYMFTSMIKF
jgi:hypothetical protein